MEALCGVKRASGFSMIVSRGQRSSDRAVICCTRAKNLSEPGVFSRAVATEMTGIEAWRSDGRDHEVSILITGGWRAWVIARG